MKKLLFLLIIPILCFADTAAQSTNRYYRCTGGANVSVSPNYVPENIYVYTSGATSVNTDYNLVFTSTPPQGTRFRVWYDVSSATLGMARTFNFFGVLIQGYEASIPGYIDYCVLPDHGGTPSIHTIKAPYMINDYIIQGTVSGASLQDHSLDLMTKGGYLPGGQIVIGGGSDDFTAVPVSGAITIDSLGFTILDSVITDAKIKTGADIKRQKLAAGNASYVLVNNSSGYMTEEATLNPLRGGLGADVSSSTGFVTFSSGSSTVGSMVDTKVFTVSFDTTSIGDVKFLMPFACTVTGIYASVTKTIQDFNDAVIVPKNDGGTVMNDGTITIPANTTIGTGYYVQPTANNVFSAYDLFTLSVSKANAGGAVLLTVIYTRNN